MFAPERWTIADSQSKDRPCDLYIDALEDSVVMVTAKDLNQAKMLLRLLNACRSVQKRVVMLMSFSAIERYARFKETYIEDYNVSLKKW